MNDKKILDEKIGRLVRSIDKNVPLAVEEKIKAAAALLHPRPRFYKLRLPLMITLVPSAAAILLAAVLLLPLFQKPQQPISEIRTEFEIADKNIKIIFFQKPDFNLFKED
jgi:hypothetical protein